MSRKKRFSSNEAKLGCVTSGINSTTKAQLKKIQSGDLDTSLPTVNYSDLYMFVKNQWVHKGKSCMLCDKVMNDPLVLEKHHYICEVNKQKQRKSLDD